METDKLFRKPGGSDGDQPLLPTASGKAMRRDDSSEDLRLSLHQSARDGHEDNIIDIIDNLKCREKKKINDYDDDKQTPLHYAAFYNHLGVVKLLVEAGANVDVKGKDDKTPLHHAAGGRSAAATRDRKKQSKSRLTSAKRKDEDSSGTSRSALFSLAVEESVITYLVNSNAYINSCDIYRQTPLHCAAVRGNEEACRGLLYFKDSIQINAPDNQGYTPLHMAVIHNRLKIVVMLLQAGADPMCRDQKMSIPLHLAAAEGKIDIVQVFFHIGAQTKKMISAVDVESSTCLHLAVENGHYKVAELLLKKGSNVNKSRKHGMRPIHLAAQSGNRSLVRLLIHEGAFLDASNEHIVTALHLAIAFNHHEVAKLLIHRGADIDFYDKSNYTPLLLAVAYGNTELMELLLREGADYTAVDTHDKTAILLACEESKYETLEKLLLYDDVKMLVNDSDVYDNSPLHIAAQEGSLSIAKLLLSNGASPDIKNMHEETPLHVAAHFGHTNIVGELIKECHSIVNYEDRDSNTALHVAAQHGHYKIVKMLLDHEADFSARNYNQRTPLDLAALEGWTKTCNVLLNEGAPVNPPGENKPPESQVREFSTYWYNNKSNRQVALVIVNSTEWKDALRNLTINPVTDYVDTPMRKLIRKMPAIADRVFDRCVSYGTQKDPECVDYEIVYDYEFLDDGYAKWITDGIKQIRNPDSSDYGSSSDDTQDSEPYTNDTNVLKKNHPLFIMVSSETEDLLTHPLVTLLLTHKWSTFGRVFYYVSFFIYFIFLVFLTGYLVSSDPPHEFSEPDQQAIENNSCPGITERHSQKLLPKIGTYVICILTVFNVLKELLQIYHARLNYLGWTNLIEWIVYITALLLVINFNDCQRQTGFRYDWQWNLGAISIFLAWIDLVLIIQTVPQIGIYVVMFTDILRTFTKFSLFAFFFIVAFALSFFTLFQNQTPFLSIRKSLLKIFVMMIGEVDFDDIFNEDKMYYKPAAYIVWIIFLVIMSILLMNLLIGLAVDGIKGVQEQAALKRLAMQVELALNMDRFMPRFIRRKQVLRRKIIRPNQVSKNPLMRVMKSSSAVTSEALQMTFNPELDEQNNIAEDVKRLKWSLRDMREQNQRLESMLRAIVTKENISWQEEDYQREDDKWRRKRMKPINYIKQYYFQC